MILLHQETHIEQLNARRSEICETCELDQIKLPTQETDSMAIDSAGSSQQIISSSSSFDYSKLSKPHQQVGTVLPVKLTINKQQSSKVVHLHTSIIVQTSNNQVLISHLQDLRPVEKEKLEMEFKAKMEFISLEVERTAPNLKALDQYESLREKEKESIEEFDAARKASKEIADKYNAIKQQR